MKKWILPLTFLIQVTVANAAAPSDFTGTYRVESCRLYVNLAETDPDALCSISQIQVQSPKPGEISISYIQNGRIYYQENLTAYSSDKGKIRDHAQFENSDDYAQWFRRYRNDVKHHNLDEMRRFEINPDDNTIRFISAVGDVLASKYKFARYEYELKKETRP